MLKGIFPVIPTFFTSEDGLDFDALKNTIQFVLEAGAHGVVFPGVASEYSFLTSEERDALISFVTEQVNNRVPIVGGASAAKPEEAIAAGQRAHEHGIDHLMIMAPRQRGTDIEAQLDFFTTIAASLPESQFILQNAPNPIGAGLNAEAIISLATQLPSITYVKEETLPSGAAISALRRADIPHLKGIFGGGDPS